MPPATLPPPDAPRARREALTWLAENADRLRRAGTWGLAHYGSIRTRPGRGAAKHLRRRTACPLSYPDEAARYEELAQRHGLPDAVARRLVEAADGYPNADPVIREALVRTLAPIGAEDAGA